jgi:hypothetical protein
VAITKESTVNKALARIGVSMFVTNLATDNTQEAVIARFFFDDVLGTLLSTFPWGFNVKRLKPTASTTVTRSDFTYAFSLAGLTDFLKPLGIWPGGLNQVTYTPVQNSSLYGVWTNPRTPRSDQRVPFKIEAASAAEVALDAGFVLNAPMLLCDFLTPEIMYVALLPYASTASPTPVTQYPGWFEDAFAWALAVELAMPLVKKLDTRKMAESGFQQAYALAQQAAFEYQQEDVQPDSEMIAVRL